MDFSTFQSLAAYLQDSPGLVNTGPGFVRLKMAHVRTGPELDKSLPVLGNPWESWNSNFCQYGFWRQCKLEYYFSACSSLFSLPKYRYICILLAFNLTFRSKAAHKDEWDLPSSCSPRSSPVLHSDYKRSVPLLIIFRPYFIWERKIFESNRFFYKICQAPNLFLILRVLPIEFNSHKFSFVRFVYVEIFGLF